MNLIHTKQGRQSLRGLEKFSGRNPIVVGSVDGDVDERLLESVDPSTALRDRSHFGIVFAALAEKARVNERN